MCGSQDSVGAGLAPPNLKCCQTIKIESCLRDRARTRTRVKNKSKRLSKKCPTKLTTTILSAGFSSLTAEAIILSTDFFLVHNAVSITLGLEAPARRLFRREGVERKWPTRKTNESFLSTLL
jgi:hypothetical protein